MTFQKGDVVEVIAEKAGPRSRNFIGKQLVVKDVRPLHSREGQQVWVEDGWYADYRFKLVAPKVLVFAVGVQVERIAPDTLYTVKGGKYTVREVVVGALGAITNIKLNEAPGLYSVKNFKVVANAPKAKEFNREDWIPQVGEKVFITGRDQYSNGAAMDVYVNNGEEYTIKYLEGECIYLEDHQWMYLAESLTPKWAMAAGKAPPPPPKLELREALYTHQVKRGLGADLCSYAFETKQGKQHLLPYVCHARLNNEYGEIVKVAYSFRHDMARVNKKNKDAHLVYSKYIISQSPWAAAFITQDINEAVEKDILMNVEVNRYMMAGACVALRTGQEYPDRPGIFKEMLDRGHNPHTCWLISCAFTKMGAAYNFNSWGGGHDVIDKHRYFDDVIKFFQTGYHLPKAKTPYHGEVDPCTKEPYRTHHGTYAIASTIADYDRAGKDPTKSIGHWFEKNTKTEVVGQGWDKKTVISVEALDEVASKLDKLIEGKA